MSLKLYWNIIILKKVNQTSTNYNNNSKCVNPLITLKANAFRERVRPNLLSDPCNSISLIHLSNCATISCLFIQKWVCMTYEIIIKRKLHYSKYFAQYVNNIINVIKCNYLFKTRARIANLIKHRPFSSSLTNIRVILLTRLSSARCTSRSFVSWFVEIRLWY